MLRTRVDEACEGLWKRVITSRDLGCFILRRPVSQSGHFCVNGVKKYVQGGTF